MIKKLTKTNICLLIIALCAVLFCGLFVISNFASKKPTTTHAYSGSSATITGMTRRTESGGYAGTAGCLLTDKLADYSIKNITITNDSMPTNYVDSPIDVSFNGDDTIHAYMIDNGDETYDCIIYADVETIYAPTISYSMFYNMSNLESINFECFDTSNVVDMSGMFLSCSSLKSLDLSNFNTSSVDNMDMMFAYCNALNSLDISSFNTSKVTDMSYMFTYCESLINLDLSHFVTNSVTDMSWMFNCCVALETLDISSFNASEVLDMNDMFQNCYELVSLDLSNFRPAKVTDTYSMFANCYKLETIDLSNFITDSVTDMSYMFGRCKSLRKLNLNSFSTSNVVDMSEMFYDCESLTEIIGLDNLDTSKVANMSGMFAGLASLDVLDLSNFDFSSITIDDNLFCMLGLNDAYILALCDSLGDTGASLKSSYQQAIDNNSVEERIQVVAYALQNLYEQSEEFALENATNFFNTNIQTIYAPTSLNSRNICLPFNNNAQYVYNDGTSEVETAFLAGRGESEELAIYVKGEYPLAKPETSAPSVTPSTGFVDEQLLPAITIGLASIMAVAVMSNKKRKVHF